MNVTHKFDGFPVLAKRSILGENFSHPAKSIVLEVATSYIDIFEHVERKML